MTKQSTLDAVVAMRTFLEGKGYKCWKEKKEGHSTVFLLQKRTDVLEDYKDYPVCHCNDKLFINVSLHAFNAANFSSASAEVGIVHENADEEWCELKVYGLKQDQILEGIDLYERKIMDMWAVFNRDLERFGDSTE